MSKMQLIALLAVQARRSQKFPYRRGLTAWTAYADPKGFREMLSRGRPDWWIQDTLSALGAV
jgi:hypothetical protein